MLVLSFQSVVHVACQWLQLSKQNFHMFYTNSLPLKPSTEQVPKS